MGVPEPKVSECFRIVYYITKFNVRIYNKDKHANHTWINSHCKTAKSLSLLQAWEYRRHCFIIRTINSWYATIPPPRTNKYKKRSVHLIKIILHPKEIGKSEEQQVPKSRPVVRNKLKEIWDEVFTMDQLKFVEQSLYKTWRDMVYLSRTYTFQLFTGYLAQI